MARLSSFIDVSVAVPATRAELGAFLATIPAGAMLLDGGGRIAGANPELERQLGYGRGELDGASIDRLLPDRSRVRHLDLLARFADDPKERPLGTGCELTVIGKDGSERAIEIGLGRIATDAGPLVLIAVVDITARKKRELDLRQAYDDLEEGSHAACHDLCAPLRGIAELMAWIAEDLGPTPPTAIKTNLDRVAARIERMDRLIDDLLAYARAGRASSAVIDIDLAALVANVLELQPRPPGFTIDVEIEAAGVKMRGVRAPIESALRNLIDNAIKHHDRGDGRVHVSVHTEGADCVFSVSDDGPGVRDADVDGLFLLNDASRGSRADVRIGSGVGLALAKRLIERHGGRIEARANDRGRGTTFRFWWPRFERRTTEDVDEKVGEGVGDKKHDRLHQRTGSIEADLTWRLSRF